MTYDNENKVKILLCEDDESLGMLLREYLQAKGFDTKLCQDGTEGFEAYNNAKYDICILDIMMPIKDGFELASNIKTINREQPIIFLSAKTLEEDIIKGFKIGADDYLTKPFSMEELILRIEAVLRRAKSKKKSKPTVFKLGSFTFDSKKQELTRNNEKKRLTTKECELLTLLALNVNDILYREDALKTIWMENNWFNARSMDVYITKLRKLLKDDENVRINNVHGKGYRLVVPDSEK